MFFSNFSSAAIVLVTASLSGQASAIFSGSSYSNNPSASQGPGWSGSVTSINPSASSGPAWTGSSYTVNPVASSGPYGDPASYQPGLDYITYHTYSSTGVYGNTLFGSIVVYPIYWGATSKWGTFSGMETRALITEFITALGASTWWTSLQANYYQTNADGSKSSIGSLTVGKLVNVDDTTSYYKAISGQNLAADTFATQLTNMINNGFITNDPHNGVYAVFMTSEMSFWTSSSSSGTLLMGEAGSTIPSNCGFHSWAVATVSKPTIDGLPAGQYGYFYTAIVKFSDGCGSNMFTSKFGKSSSDAVCSCAQRIGVATNTMTTSDKGVHTMFAYTNQFTHELFEAITDPLWGTAWYYQISSKGVTTEMMDICEDTYYGVSTVSLSGSSFPGNANFFYNPPGGCSSSSTQTSGSGVTVNGQKYCRAFLLQAVWQPANKRCGNTA